MPGVRRTDLHATVERVFNQCLREGFAHHIGKKQARKGVQNGAMREVERRTGVNQGTVSKWVRKGFVKPDYSLYRERKAKPLPPLPEPVVVLDLHSEIPKALKRLVLTTDQLANKFGLPPQAITDAISDLQTAGVSIQRVGHDGWSLTPPEAGRVRGRAFTFKTDAKHWLKFGVVADAHLGSKYSRLDVLESLYDHFEAEGVKVVFNLGNWIDGEAKFNKHELLVHGMDAQMRYLAKYYPQRDGITTYAVTGDDHEGWYAQREGINVGQYAENKFKEAGRSDWVDMGYMTAYAEIVNAKTGIRSIIEVTHPGGGSAYADSYAVQKAIEAMEGGEKPAIWLGGHYHKMICVAYRNVWAFLCGCTKDLDTFGRKKKLRYVIGGAICEAQQDPNTGAVPRFRVDQFQYYNRGYYNGRWSHHDDVVLPERAMSP
ncbi:MAG: hypothetical protein JNK21_08805 [Rhodospirillaceae bacterium]|nr:hypothetical protein [Rhodospirillaceae bacterium]